MIEKVSAISHPLPSRLVQLEDCGHVVDSKKLDMLICKTMEDGQISLLVCPTCATPINKTKRYRNTTRVTNRKIQAVKSQVLYEFRSMFTKIGFLKSKLHSNLHYEIFEDLVGLVHKMLKESNSTESPHNYYSVLMMSEWLIELMNLHSINTMGLITRNFEHRKFIESRLLMNLHSRNTMEFITTNFELWKFIESRLESLSKSMQIYLKSMNYEIMNRFDLEVLRVKRMIHLLDKSLEQPINQEAFILLFSSNAYSVEMDEEICTKLKVEDKYLKSVPSSNKNVNLSENIWFQCLSDHVYCETRSSGRICTRCSYKQKKKRDSFLIDQDIGEKENERFPCRRNEEFRKNTTVQTIGRRYQEQRFNGPNRFAYKKGFHQSVQSPIAGLASNAQTPIHNLEKELHQRLRSIPGYGKYSAPAHREYSVLGNGVYSAPGLRRNSAPGYKGTFASESEKSRHRGNFSLEHERNSVPQRKRNFSSEKGRNSAGKENSTPGHGTNSVPRHRNKRQAGKYPADCYPQNKIPSLLHMKLEKPPSLQADSSSSKLKVSANTTIHTKKKKEKSKR